MQEEVRYIYLYLSSGKVGVKKKKKAMFPSAESHGSIAQVASLAGGQ